MSASEFFPGPERSPVDGHLGPNLSMAGVDNAAPLDASDAETDVEVLAGRRLPSTVHGGADSPLWRVGDLVEFEGNRHVVVDLGQATARSPAGVAVFATAAGASYNHGGTLTLTNVPAVLGEGLRRHGLGDIVSGPSPAMPGLR